MIAQLKKLSKGVQASLAGIVILLIASNVFWSWTLNNTRALYALGIEKISKKNFDGAIQDFNIALSQNAEDPSAHFGMGWALQLSERRAQAIPHYLKAMTKAEELLGYSYNNLQFIMQNQNNPIEAGKLGQKRELLKQIQAIR